MGAFRRMTPMVFIKRFCLAVRKSLQLKKNSIAKMIVCKHTALKKLRKSLEERKEVITLPHRIPLQLTRLNTAVAAKEHFIVHLCLGLALRKP
ncbi:unnamed protein product [Nezara viridula]|uniref:Uncharacterized protein n=1 Tax=Nezara viridula TaxID=85310 RepID=A0A9P0E3I5_NEZVI|nr:unnamed protein product [Nezara viridula]